jgi:hypothetical protein
MKTSYSQVLQNAAHYKALGMNDIYLDDTSGALPWEHTVSVEEGGSHRLDISTNVWFRAKEPNTGLTFRWSFDIEPYSANGSGSYHIDVDSCKRVLALLPSDVRVSFREYLLNCAGKVKARADEYHQLAMRQAKEAAILQDLGTVELCAKQPITRQAQKPVRKQ